MFCNFVSPSVFTRLQAFVVVITRVLLAIWLDLCSVNCKQQGVLKTPRCVDLVIRGEDRLDYRRQRVFPLIRYVSVGVCNRRSTRPVLLPLTNLETYMVKLISRVGRKSSQFLLITAMTSLLVACGGGGAGDGDGDSDTTEPFPDLDSDNDGTLNSVDDDDDGDLILDVEDNFIDRDNDGFDDISGFTNEELNPTLTPDVPGDNDGDGFIDVTDASPCGGETGQDNSSINNIWNDNCAVRRSTVNGQFADSLFSVGIQRVVYCEGFGAGASYTNFADGEFGPGSEAALQEFQRRESLVDDGAVGPQTWANLQGQIELLGDPGQFDVTSGFGIDTYGFADGRCAGIPMFYQQTQAGEDGLSVETLGWSLARNQPNETQTLSFSIDSPFIDL